MKKITIYALSTCLWCKKTKKYFEEKGLPFDSVEYDKLDPEAQERTLRHVKACGGTGAFPFVQIGDGCVQGYDPAEFEKKLGAE